MAIVVMRVNMCLGDIQYTLDKFIYSVSNSKWCQKTKWSKETNRTVCDLEKDQTQKVRELSAIQNRELQVCFIKTQLSSKTH